MQITFKNSDVKKIANAIRTDLMVANSILHEDLCLESTILDDVSLVELYLSGDLIEDYSILMEAAEKSADAIIKKIDDETEDNTPGLLKRVIKILVGAGLAASAIVLGTKFTSAYKKISKSKPNLSKMKKSREALKQISNSISSAFSRVKGAPKKWWETAKNSLKAKKQPKTAVKKALKAKKK